MHRWAGSTLIQVMACYLFGAEPLPELMLTFVNKTIRNKLHWNLNQNTIFFTDENAFEKVICEMEAILSRGRWVNLPDTTASTDQLYTTEYCHKMGGDHLSPTDYQTDKEMMAPGKQKVACEIYFSTWSIRFYAEIFYLTGFCANMFSNALYFEMRECKFQSTFYCNLLFEFQLTNQPWSGYDCSLFKKFDREKRYINHYNQCSISATDLASD